MDEPADIGEGADLWLLRDVSLIDGWRGDVALRAGRIETLGADLSLPGARCVDADGGCLVPGLRDHHLHLLAAAARRESLVCGGAEIADSAALQRRLAEASPNAHGWIRGVDYHPGIAGELDRETLDAWVPSIPLRIQHASGRLWYMNSAAIRRLGEEGPWERVDGRITGRLFEADDWLAQRAAGGLPDLSGLSRELASLGIVGVTDTGPRNGPDMLDLFSKARDSGALRQELLLMGDGRLDPLHATNQATSGVRIGARKFHLLESALPDIDDISEQICASHACGRPVAFHCVSRVELVFALGALEQAGCRAGDRIEHLGVCGPDEFALMRAMPLTVVSQPVFIRERGDRYLREVDVADQADLYRLHSVEAAGLALAGSSDAPHGALSPWMGMAAAVSRRTAAGAAIGPEETLTPERALALYTGALTRPGTPAPPLAAGQPADLCLLDRGWLQAREDLAAVRVRQTWKSGRSIWAAA